MEICLKAEINFVLSAEIRLRYTNKDGNIVCPKCKIEQNAQNYFCVQCGQMFINGQPDIPYWCAQCGHEGPYEYSCPECGSSATIINKKV